MEDDEDQSRFLATCDECGSVYAAMETADGQITPIGSRTGCPCGSTSFSCVTDTDPGESSEEE